MNKHDYRIEKIVSTAESEVKLLYRRVSRLSINPYDIAHGMRVHYVSISQTLNYQQLPLGHLKIIQTMISASLEFTRVQFSESHSR